MRSTLEEANIRKNTFVTITPMQSLYIHGLFSTRKSLSWIDIVDNKNITAKSLIKLGLSAQQLQHIQSDQNIWVQYGKVDTSDVEALQAWPLHPVDHLKMNLLDLIERKFSPNLLKKLGITYDYLIEKLSMDFKALILFGFSWNQWMDLGMTVSHVKYLTPKQVASLFNIQCNNDVHNTAIAKMNSYHCNQNLC